MRNAFWAGLSCGVVLAACGGGVATTGTGLGERCSVLNNDDDCQTGLVCTPAAILGGESDICCLSPVQDNTVAACTPNFGTGGAGTTGAGATGSGAGATSTTGTTSTTTSTGTTGGGGAEPGCQPILSQTGQDTGFDTCAGGTIERQAQLACPTAASSPTNSCAMQHGATCTSDADCTAQPLGYCADSRDLVGYCGCFYGCVQDADCGAGNVCDCGSVVGTCVPSTCTTNASCGAGSACVLSGSVTAMGGCGGDVFGCSSSKDQCQSDMDCQATGGECLRDGDHRACSSACAMHP